jgi:hypothetical protein
VALAFHMKVEPWVNFYQKRQESFAAKPKEPAAKPKKDDKKAKITIQRGMVGKKAIESLKQGKDTMDLRIDRHDKQVQVRFHADEGLIRFAGEVIAQFVKENLE